MEFPSSFDRELLVTPFRGFHVGDAVMFFLTSTATFLTLTAALFSHWHDCNFAVDTCYSDCNFAVDVMN